MDPTFVELHKSVMQRVEATLQSIEMNMRMGNLNKEPAAKERYAKMRSALKFWMDAYGKPATEEEVAEGIVLLNNVLSELK
ncbi:MAG: hypothetical protein QXU54_01410 [Candidatus Micrarchaeia archaeon]